MLEKCPKNIHHVCCICRHGLRVRQGGYTCRNLQPLHLLVLTNQIDAPSVSGDVCTACVINLKNKLVSSTFQKIPYTSQGNQRALLYCIRFPQQANQMQNFILTICVAQSATMVV